jgi:hypothetical protein
MTTQYGNEAQIGSFNNGFLFITGTADETAGAGFIILIALANKRSLGRPSLWPWFISER